MICSGQKSRSVQFVKSICKITGLSFFPYNEDSKDRDNALSGFSFQSVYDL